MRCNQCPTRGDYCVINQVGIVTLPPPILLKFEASQHTTQKVNRTELYTRWRWSPAIQTPSSSRWAKQAVPNPARQSETLKTTPEVQLGKRAAGPSWQNGVFTFLRRRGHSTPPVSGIHKSLCAPGTKGKQEFDREQACTRPAAVNVYSIRAWASLSCDVDASRYPLFRPWFCKLKFGNVLLNSH